MSFAVNWGAYVRLWTLRTPFLWFAFALIFGWWMSTGGYFVYMISVLVVMLYLILGALWNRYYTAVFLAVISSGIGIYQIDYLHHHEQLKQIDQLPERFIAELQITECDERNKSGMGKLAIVDKVEIEPINVRYFRKENDILLMPGDILTVFVKKIPWQAPMVKGDFDEFSYYKSKSVFLKISIDDEERTDFSKNYFYYRSQFKKRIRETIKEIMSPEAGSIAFAAITGDKSQVERAYKDKLGKSGLMHLLAVSGFHVGILFAMAMKLFGLFPVLKRLRFLIAIGVTWAYVVIIGMPASAVRAALMLSAASWGIFQGRSIFTWSNYWLAFVLILVFRPAQITDRGFILSFSALAGILFFLPSIRLFHFKLRNRRHHFLAYAIGIMGVSFAAQMGTLIPASLWFGGQNIFSIVANLLVIPIFSLFMTLLYLRVTIGILFPLIDLPLSFIFDFPIKFIDVISEIFASHAAIFNIFEYGSFGILFYLILICYYWQGRAWAARYLTYSLITILGILLLVLPLKIPLELIQMNVGQGDSAVLISGEKYFLFDAGNKKKRFSYAIENLIGKQKIESAAITHADLDHFGGLLTLRKPNTVKRLILPVIQTGSLMDSLLRKYNLPDIHKQTAAVSLLYGDSYCRIYCIEDGRWGKFYNWDKNNSSSIFLVETLNWRYLITGDAETKEETTLTPWLPLISNSILKVGHHGSGKGTGLPFLRHLRPRLAVISCGLNNRYGHPSAALLERLEEINCPVYRIDLQGYWSSEGKGDLLSSIESN